MPRVARTGPQHAVPTHCWPVEQSERPGEGLYPAAVGQETNRGHLKPEELPRTSSVDVSASLTAVDTPSAKTTFRKKDNFLYSHASTQWKFLAGSAFNYTDLYTNKIVFVRQQMTSWSFLAYQISKGSSSVYHVQFRASNLSSQLLSLFSTVFIHLKTHSFVFVKPSSL